MENQKQVRVVRHFSESFKQEKVREIERNLTTVMQVSKVYGVTRAAVYKWLYKYSAHHKKQIRQIIEPMSDTRKIKEMKQKIKELERLVGQKQILLEFREKQIEIAEEMYKIDIKKTWHSSIEYFRINRKGQHWKMSALYRVLGTTKQNVHQWIRRQQSREVHQEWLCGQTAQLRVDHPRMGGKNLYKKSCPSFMGRDRFLGWHRASGFMLAPKRNFRRTTDSSGVIRSEPDGELGVDTCQPSLGK